MDQDEDRKITSKNKERKINFLAFELNDIKNNKGSLTL